MSDPITPRTLLTDLLEEADFFGGNGICPVLFEDSTLPNVLVISGENAGGKSFLCKVMTQHAREYAEIDGFKLETMLVGMQMRTASGIQKALMFGDESWESTGNISVRTALTGINTAIGRTHRHWLVLDEPDIGLAEGYAAALGRRFAEFASDLPENTLGFIVVSHSRALVRPLIHAGAMSARVGLDRRPVAEWLEHGDQERSLEDLEGLKKSAHQRFLAIRSALAARKDEEKSEPKP